MKVSLIITTYNWPEALAVTLDSVKRQSCRRLEIVIADDGSGEATAGVIRRSLAGSGFTWRHVRHADHGIRQARIKNLAVKYSQGDYLIFIDHDVALHPAFVDDHLRNCQEDCLLQGKRVFLPARLTRDYLLAGTFQPPSPFTPGLQNRKNAFRLPVLGRLFARKKRFQITLRGCNLSMHRTAFVAVDGYDELFDGLWGREDSDICYRMFNNRIGLKNLWFSGLQFHLDHRSIKRTGRDRLDDELEHVLREKRTRAVHGYSKLSDEGIMIDGSEHAA